MNFDSAFYHIKNLQSTKTNTAAVVENNRFYHIKNLQSTKTNLCICFSCCSFITLRIYKVLKRVQRERKASSVLSH